MSETIISQNEVDIFSRVIERVKGAGAQACLISYGTSQSTDIQFEAGRIKEAGASDKSSYMIEVLLNGRKAVASGNRMDKVQDVADQALALVKHGSAAHFTAYPQPTEVKELMSWSEATAEWSRQSMIEDCEVMRDEILAYDPSLYLVCTASMTEGHSLLMTDSGILLMDRENSWRLGSYAQRTQGTDMVLAYQGRGWGDLKCYHDPAAVSKDLIRSFQRAERITAIPEGRMLALLPPEIVGNFLWPVIMGIDGKSVYKGTSPLKGRLEEQILDSCIDLTDRPHEDYAPGCAAWDGTGIPTRNQDLVNQGVLKTFLYDLNTAGLAGTQPTGNSGCQPYHVMMSKGRQSHESLLSGIESGIYVEELIGYGQGNIINGDFSANVGLGYRIEKGELAGRVKNVMISGNIYDLFARNVQLSSDTNYFGSTPYALVEGLSVSAG